jgi:hypothetical protein
MCMCCEECSSTQCALAAEHNDLHLQQCRERERAIARLIFSPGGEQIVAVICHEYFRNCRRQADRLLLMDDCAANALVKDCARVISLYAIMEWIVHCDKIRLICCLCPPLCFVRERGRSGRCNCVLLLGALQISGKRDVQSF